jgi:hypothetical protein
MDLESASQSIYRATCEVQWSTEYLNRTQYGDSTEAYRSCTKPEFAGNTMSEEVLGNKARMGAISTRPSEASGQSAHSASTIAIAGLAAGAIDLGFNTFKALTAGTSVLRPWKGVAAALLGKDAVIHGGDFMAIVGVGLHFAITIGASAVYYLVAKRQGWLVRHPFLSGLVFGALFFLAMNYVILPLSVIGHPLYVGAETIATALPGHIIMIGLPISLIVGWRLK